MPLFTRRTEQVPCTVEVSHRFESRSTPMSALTTAPWSFPATRSKCMAPRSWPPMARSSSGARTATITRASGLERLWTRLTGDLGVHGTVRIFLLR